MPFNQLRRRDSWPPTILHLHPNPNSPSPSHQNNTSSSDSPPEDIDPLTYFLTPSASLEDLSSEAFPFELDDDLSAGIEDSSHAKPIVREISPSKLQRAPLKSPSTYDTENDADSLDDDDELDAVHFDFTMPLLSLQDFSTAHRAGRKSRLDNYRVDEDLRGLGISLSSSPSNARGRAKVRLMPTSRGRGQTRSLSIPRRRPHSWREPSPELGRIEEEAEDVNEIDSGGEGEREGQVLRVRADVRILSSSAPPPTVSAMRMPGTPKKTKRVHWAE